MSSSLLRTFVLPALLCAPWSVHGGPVPDDIFANGFEARCIGGVGDPDDCVAVPFNQALPQAQRRIETIASWNRLDVYLLLDNTLSMNAEVVSVRAQAANLFGQLRCPPEGTGAPGQCTSSLWTGFGTFAFPDSGPDAYRHLRDMGETLDFSALPTASTPLGGSNMEVHRLALHAAVTGSGGASCAVAGLGARATCAGSPAGADGSGYACFRPDATPLVVLFSDEQTSVNFTCPDWPTIVQPAYTARGARLAAVTGAGAAAAVTTEFQGFANATRAVNVGAGNLPLVDSGGDANAATAAFNLVRSFISGAPLDVDIQFIDDPSDAVDASIFVDHVEVLQEGTAECANGLTAVDTGGHPSADRYTNVRGGTPVCFNVVLAPNTTVASGAEAREFLAMLRVVSDSGMTIEEIPLTFVVPRG